MWQPVRQESRPGERVTTLPERPPVEPYFRVGNSMTSLKWITETWSSSVISRE
jgi:hypothetical protein